MSDKEPGTTAETIPPKKHEMRFGSGLNWQTKACTFTGFDDIIYQDGYRRAALRLANSVAKAETKRTFCSIQSSICIDTMLS